MKPQMRNSRDYRIYQKSIFFLLLSIFLIFLPATTLIVSGEENRIVRVAFFPMEGYHMRLSDGTCTGMDVDYLEALSKYAGWQIEYIDCDSWDDALSMLAEEEVDLVGSAQYSDARAEIFQYADLPSGYTFGSIAVNDSSSFAYEDFDAMKQITFGLVETYVRKAEFLQYLSDNGIDDPKIREYENTAELQQALSDGEVDAIVHTMMELNDGQRIIGRFALTPYYYITYKNNTQLLHELNQAISQLKMNEPSLEYTLMNKYYESKLNHKEVLTLAEKNYVEAAGSLTIGYLDGFYPISYESNGEYCGLMRESFDDLAENLGISFVYLKMDSPDAAAEALNSGTIDILSCSTDTEESLHRENLSTAKIYAYVPLAMLTRSENRPSEIHTLATISTLESIAEEVIDLESADILFCGDVLSCIEAVSNGDADAALCPAYQASYLTENDYSFHNIEIQNVLSEEETVRVVVNSSNTLLISILEKSLYASNDRAISEYVLQHTETTGFVLVRWFRNHMMIICSACFMAIFTVLLIALKLLYDSRKIQHLMYHDWELDIWNLNYLLYRGERILNLRRKETFAIVSVNLYHFRLYNTVYGWHSGNRLLASIVKVLSENIDKKSEIYAHIQSDRFVLMLHYDTEKDLPERLEHLRLRIESQILQDMEYPMKVLMGVSYLAAGSKDLRTELSRANLALEFLPEDSIHQIRIYDEALDIQIKEQHSKERLLDAVDIPTDFVVYYQDKVDIRTEKIIGAEALVRFCDPTVLGLIRTPDYFISYYEKTGRIREIDFFVLESVCRMLRRRMDAEKEVVPVSCNFSRCNFIEETFPDKLIKVLDHYQIPRNLIEVEITETIVMDELQQQVIQRTLNKLRKKGIRFSIDDFGAGYSSLGIFEKISASVIKLDRSFLLNQTDRSRQIKIMQNVVNLADDLHVQVLCEGVETDKDVELMTLIGAYIAQGYRYSRPSPEIIFEQHLDQHFAR